MEQIKRSICDKVIPVLAVLAMLGGQSAAVAQEKSATPDSTCRGNCLKVKAQKLVASLFSYPKQFSLGAIEHIANQTGPMVDLRGTTGTHPIGPTQWDMDKISFYDNTTLVGQLRGIEDLSLITFWENSSAKLYLGVSKDGIAGINIRQKRHRRPGNNPGSRKSSKLDERPVIHDPYAFAVVY